MINANEAEHRKNEAQDSSYNKESSEWKESAIQLIINVARREEYFIVDSVREMAIKTGVGEPEHYGVWGAMFREAARRKIIQKTNIYKPSSWKKNNMGLRNIWKSLIFEKPMDNSNNYPQPEQAMALEVAKAISEI